jgi:hypothetical protein
MNIKLMGGALIIAASLLATTPFSHGLAQSNVVMAKASTSASQNVGSTKHRYWRHRGGTHPHYGSRRVRT